mmetsp:Transcript_32413/g.52467  ORF Transcript_32413/g.52467 Transcript_32413/m.52467 type:complete len:168 (-) Transcript_32413:53-556(-)
MLRLDGATLSSLRLTRVFPSPPSRLPLTTTTLTEHSAFLLTCSRHNAITLERIHTNELTSGEESSSIQTGPATAAPPTPPPTTHNLISPRRSPHLISSPLLSSHLVALDMGLGLGRGWVGLGCGMGCCGLGYWNRKEVSASICCFEVGPLPNQHNLQPYMLYLPYLA